MVDVRELAEKALAYKEKGLSEREIADELHLSIDTVKYLIEEGGAGVLPPSDVKIGWRSIGVYGSRISMMSDILADIIIEELDKRNLSADVVLGIAINGVSFATVISDILGMELAVYKPPAERGKKGGAFSSNYASVENKNVIIVDDVISTGATLQEAIKDIRENGGNPVLAVVIVNKSSLNEIDGVPLRGVIRARSMGGTILGGGPLHSFPYG
ncbi:MAG: orotate phosphoribosyltransferase-like protein [Methanomassiliicoccales archaeon]|jgi:orotate phosphoribosyltransferase|nr:orotate phosphoribosyltransferase-like protein [Methanomassiliicoccales archaeon]